MKLKAIPFILLFIMLLPASALANLSKTDISQLYVAIFNRASEGEGNLYWQSLGLDMATTADVMLETDAAKNYFGESLNTNQSFIEHIFYNTLDKTRAEDPDGIAYWVDLLDGGLSRGAVVAGLVSVIENYAPGGPYYDSTSLSTMAAYNQFINRLIVSDYMADNVYETPADWETSTSFDSVGLNVTYDESSLYAAMDSIDGGTPLLLVTPKNKNVGSDSGTVSFLVSNNGTGSMDWATEVSSGGGWLSISSGESGSDAGTITCLYDTNTSTATRTGTIRIIANGASGSPMDVTVTQQAQTPCTYSISPTRGSFSADGENKSISVTPSSSNCTWTTSESLSWVSLSLTSGTGSGSVTVSVDPNTGDARSGSVTIAGETYNISQAAFVFDSYESMFTKSASSSGVNIQGYWQAGSSFSFQITNISNQNFDLFKAELRNGNAIVGKTTDISLLSDGVLEPSESVSLQFALNMSLQDNGFTFIYYLSDISTGENFEIQQDYEPW
jgi:hypothetical protein